MSYNILDVVRDAAKGELEMAPPSVIESRNEKCSQCEIAIAGFCSECGCLIQAKIRLAKSECPLGTWEKREKIDK